MFQGKNYATLEIAAELKLQEQGSTNIPKM